MEFIQNPNFVYLLLAGGLALAVLAMASPGTGLLEVGAVAVLLAAGGLVAAYQLPVNLWALGIIIIGAGLFALSVRRPKQYILLALSILALVLGSAYLFAAEDWWRPGVDLVLASVVSLALGGFFWVAARKAVEAEMVRPRHDLTTLIGAMGEARSEVYKEGSVYVEGELWSARSRTPIPDGAPVRVVGRDGFALLVEPAAASDQGTSNRSAPASNSAEEINP